MKYEDFPKAKILCERIDELERKRSKISNADNLRLCNSNGDPTLNIPIGKGYDTCQYQSYAYQFRDSVLSDIDKEIEGLKKELGTI